MDQEDETFFEINIFRVKKRQNGNLEVFFQKKSGSVMECQLQHMPRGFAVPQRLWLFFGIPGTNKNSLLSGLAHQPSSYLVGHPCIIGKKLQNEIGNSD